MGCVVLVTQCCASKHCLATIIQYNKLVFTLSFFFLFFIVASKLVSLRLMLLLSQSLYIKLKEKNGLCV